MLSNTFTMALLIVVSGGFLTIGILHARRFSLTVEEYIVARGSSGPATATATIVASVAGAWILFSPAETATWAGLIGLIGYGIGQAAPLLAFVFLGPRMRKLMPSGHALTEYVYHRYGIYMYVFVLVVLLFYMFIFLSAELTGISLAMNLIGDTSLWLSALVIGLLTVGYTTYGGIRASIFTDSIQFIFILPLLAVVFVASFGSAGGVQLALDTVLEKAPNLLSLSHGPGLEFGIVLIIAILSANMFHQGFWQRVYNAQDDAALKNGFILGGIVVVPLILLAGVLGILAVSQDVVGETPSIALFSLVQTTLPTWAVVLVLVLALVLVMSSMDTLLNGIVSTVTSDLARFRPDISGSSLLSSSRGLTVALIIPAVFIASQGYSVLYLFLIADMVSAAALFPTFWGMYSRRFNGTMAVVSGLIGLFIGSILFPTTEFQAWNSLPLSGRFIASFGLALVASTVSSIMLTILCSRGQKKFDFNLLRNQVSLIDE